jgi:hypothetical protein
MVRRLQSITASCPPQNLTARVASGQSLRHHDSARRATKGCHARGDTVHQGGTRNMPKKLVDIDGLTAQ